MAILAIDTSTDLMSVAVVDEAAVLASYEVLAERPHAAELPQAVTRVLAAAGLTLPQIEALAIDLGPGSFTGLRIGLAFVKALAFATRRPVIGVPSLDVLAAGVPYAAGAICPILDARQRKLYAARYRAGEPGPVREVEPMLGSIDDVVGVAGQGPTLFLGDGLRVYRDVLTERLGARATFVPPELWLPRAATLGRLALPRLRAGQLDPARDLVPLYLHAMTAMIRPSDRPPGAPRRSGNLQKR
jgi:tRNA threonylcarbamoyladenosine biosynthesis protein TsaB